LIEDHLESVAIKLALARDAGDGLAPLNCERSITAGKGLSTPERACSIRGMVARFESIDCG
jgi:hypothetical protein